MVRMTAVKSISAPQLEVMLKVKQGDNPEFAFLKPDNECHSYYVWLKEQQEQMRKEKATVEKAGGLDLLDMYSSSSDEESTCDEVKLGGDAVATPSADASIEPDVGVTAASTIAVEKVKRPNNAVVGDDDEAKKARRLKRAKLMRGHYRLQLMEGFRPDSNS